MSAPPTMADIADRTGISRAAVSYVLNGQARKRRISPAVERKILRAARQMNYRPSLVARSLVARKTFTLGLLVPQLGQTFNPTLAGAVVAEAQRHGYQVIVNQHSEDPEQFRRALQTLLGWRVDGAIVMPMVKMRGTEAHRELTAAVEAGAAVVLVERSLRDPALTVVVPDTAAAARIATEHLLAAGHQRIAILLGSRIFAESADRERGFRAAMRAAGLDVHPDWLIASIFGPDIAAQVEKNIDAVVRAERRPTALVIVNPTRAILAVEELARRGLHVPRDISVVMLSGERSPPYYRPQLSTVLMDYAEVGRQAVRTLLAYVKQNASEPPSRPRRPRRVLIASTWDAGQSIAPPAGDGPIV